MHNSCFRHLERCRHRLNSRGTLSSGNYGFCYLNLAGITKFKYEREDEKDSGRSSKMTPSCKWPIVVSIISRFHWLFV